jgi:hypothetical protein
VSNASVEEALAVARKRHAAIASGDVDLFMATDEELGQACKAVLGAGADALSAADIPQLDELIALETQSRRLLEQLMDEASARMGELRQNTRARDAYLRHEQFSVNRV